ncbi:MAG: hypothetical protein ACLQDA_09225 [Terracidiphilus sp.]
MYLAEVAEFEPLARRFVEASVKKRYMDMADTYRLLAEERRRHIDGKLDWKVPPNQTETPHECHGPDTVRAGTS